MMNSNAQRSTQLVYSREKREQHHSINTSISTPASSRNGYLIERSPQLDSLKNRVAQLPTGRFNNVAEYNKSYSYPVMSSQTTNDFTIRPDGSVPVNFSNEFNDTFTVEIQMVRINFSIMVKKSSGSEIVHSPKLQAFFVTIGDIFKHYFKTHMSASSVTSKTKKKGKRGDDEDLAAIKDENAYVHDWVLKSLKADSLNGDLRAVLGQISDWRNDFNLWTKLHDEGFLRTLGYDFTAFCRTYAVLPLKYAEDLAAVEERLYDLSTFDLVKRLIDYFVLGKDPSSIRYILASRWVKPPRQFFDEPQSIVELLEKNGKELSEWYSDYDFVKNTLTKELNEKYKAEIEEKYLPVVFHRITAVGTMYPLHALRTIHLLSWSIDDFLEIRELVRRATYVLMNSKNKYLINKRGKFSGYDSYAVSGNDGRFSVPSKWERTHKHDVVRREMAV